MLWKTLALALVAVERSSGQGMMPMMRFGCSQLVIDRVDPLVNPGAVPSPHLHQIVGGNSFNASMDPATHDLVTESTCTSCTFTEDFSNYWTAVLFFRARNGTFKRVPQAQEENLRGNGGITVYYVCGSLDWPLIRAFWCFLSFSSFLFFFFLFKKKLITFHQIPSSNAKNSVTAFKPGFRMLVGDASKTSPGGARKVCHRCMPESGDNRNINCGSPDSETLPNKPCVGGIRSVITFPTCWDGKNIDSPDHQSHVAYATGAEPNDVGPTGTCPESHPVVIPQVMYEVRWQVREAAPWRKRDSVLTLFFQTQLFTGEDLWPEDGSQPFVWSTGDE